MTQKKTAPPNKLVLTTTEIALAKKLGMTPQQYAQQRAMYATQNPNWPMPQEDGFTNDPNKQPIMNVPIKTLHDLWLAKFGNTWVEVDALDEEWDKIYGRMLDYDLFEEYDAEEWVKLKDEL